MAPYWAPRTKVKVCAYDAQETVKSDDGFVETYALSEYTKVREDREKAKASDIDTSDRVLVVALKDDSALGARRVIVRSK